MGASGGKAAAGSNAVSPRAKAKTSSAGLAYHVRDLSTSSYWTYVAPTSFASRLRTGHG